MCHIRVPRWQRLALVVAEVETGLGVSRRASL